MISILIPIFNFDVRLLVAELVEELAELGITHEIRAYDDGSYFDFRIGNQRIAAYPHVIYRELPENTGPAKLRNLLARDAQFPLVLFIDSDTQCGNKQFIAKYLSRASEHKVLVGGVIFNDEIPSDPQLTLHWQYGKVRHGVSIAKRNKRPYKYFTASNFLAPKDLFEQVQFDESPEARGHEDTLFAIALKKADFPLVQLENPVQQLGLKTTHHFIESSKTAVQNLAKLIRQGKIDKGVNLFKWYRRILRLGVLQLSFRKLDRNRNTYLNQLYSHQPQIKNLEKLKLLWLIEALNPKTR